MVSTKLLNFLYINYLNEIHLLNIYLIYIQYFVIDDSPLINPFFATGLFLYPPPPRKHYKTKAFIIFSGGRERDQRYEIVNAGLKIQTRTLQEKKNNTQLDEAVNLTLQQQNQIYDLRLN